MNIIKPSLTVIVLSSALFQAAFAENLHYNLVKFSESASVLVSNDTMSVVLRITENAKSRVQAADSVTRRVNAILARAKANKSFKVESGNRQAYPEYGENRRIVSWSDSAEIRIESQDFAALNQLIADSQNDAEINNMAFFVSPEKHAQAVEQASEKALRAFKYRAEKVGKILGLGQHKIVEITLNQSFENMENDAIAPATMMSSMKMVRSTPVMQTSTGNTQIRQTVHGSVQFF
ncbi:MAG: SIMPL domain-containing protein [Alysiella sp.]|uniref:SIMPL domain-containing protein n=1 Tax=Alysiella sp. TaxID=1872483 RepID=UPI0026DAF288|nr:SIMPL domain-containing protein [Alysiella sp.]MDO4432981.1 SIMPL domain-containing protein [Alysiella sp.]